MNVLHSIIATKKRYLVISLVVLLIGMIGVGAYTFYLQQRKFVFREIQFGEEISLPAKYTTQDIVSLIRDAGIEVEDYLGSSVKKYSDQLNFKQIAADTNTFNVNNLKLLLISKDNQVSSLGVLYDTTTANCGDGCKSFPKLPFSWDVGSFKSYIADWNNNDRLDTYINFTQYTDIPLVTITKDYQVPVTPPFVDVGFIYGDIGSLEDLSEVLFKWYTE